ncbi:hypothetical protein LTR08_007687 [Meristemomyces frigidus]|nr:hypothetical protein LTR08_007687 [Meristemomyces frigidus]
MLEAIPPPPPRPRTLAGRKRKRTPSRPLLPAPPPAHPYLAGNFKPIHTTLPLTPCTFVGTIPEELADGEYVRNGGNPVANGEADRDAHWFDGDGVLAGVLFRRVKRQEGDGGSGRSGGDGDGEDGEDMEGDGAIQPEFVNAFVLTDLYLSTLASPRLKVPILPSIATLVNPLASVFYVFSRILRTLCLVLLSWLPGSRQRIKRISVANTHVVFHDGRALATCESGPPMRILLPGLETVGWFNGAFSEGEKSAAQLEAEKQAAGKEAAREREKVFGEDGGVMAFMREWTTAHPKVDPVTKEMVMFHSCFAPPYVQYSILPQQQQQDSSSPSPSVTITDPPTPRQQTREKMLNVPIPGITSAKMMHDFGVSLAHTVIMDLPLSLDPMNLLTGKPTVAYDPSKPSRFGVFPRRHPELVRWFETEACCIFHTANTWDHVDADVDVGEREGGSGEVQEVSMLACRLTSATLVFAAGNIAAPVAKKAGKPAEASVERRMPFYSKYDDGDDATMYERAPLLESPSADDDDDEKAELLHISPQEILDDDDDDNADADTTPASLSDEEQCRLYYYAFSLSTGRISHQWALTTLPFEFPSVRPDREMQDARYVYGCSTSSATFGAALGKATKIDVLLKVDARTLIARGRARPPRSVTGAVDQRGVAEILEGDEGDVAQLCADGDVPPDEEGEGEGGDGDGDGDGGGGVGKAKSELWILDARDMKTVVARVRLPQRVPYGLHGSWFPAEQIRGQRGVDGMRSAEGVGGGRGGGGWMAVRDWVEGVLG